MEPRVKGELRCVFCLTNGGGKLSGDKLRELRRMVLWGTWKGTKRGGWRELLGMVRGRESRDDECSI